MKTRTIRIAASQYDALKHLAAESGVTLGTHLRQAVAWYMEVEAPIHIKRAREDSERRLRAKKDRLSDG